MFLELTQDGGQKVAVNFDQVQLILPIDHGTDLVLAGGGSVRVVEHMDIIVYRLRTLKAYGG